MSIHIAAKQGEIADKILLPGDPLRAKFIAENFLEDAVCFNEVRNMFGYTGTYKGERVSVMGTGMGMPSISIYARELIVDYGVKKLIRVGTAGSLNEDVHVRELVLAQAAATNSNIIRNDWPQYDFPQIASFDLLDKAYHIAKDLGIIYPFALYPAKVPETNNFTCIYGGFQLSAVSSGNKIAQI